jgi:TPP-dependent pyruvate/acetoin dehydrogenase alpha subunit
MVRIRALEERIQTLYMENRLISMSPHLSIGQEAVAAGVCAVLHKDDYILTTHRGHGHCLAKGAQMRLMLAELCGRETGYCRGRGGTMHIADIGTGNLGANGIVGAGLPIACGAGLSIKYRGTDQVVACFFGDGASNQGTFHESVNMAAAFKLPVVFVCENNLYALSTLHGKVSATADVADRAKGYDIPGVVVDGMDVLAVYEVAAEAVAYAREGHGPSLIECKTYRYLGHGLSDHRPYRTREEEEEWRRDRDCLDRFQRLLIAQNCLTSEGFEEIKRDAAREAEDAAEYALASPWPQPGAVTENIY